MGRGDEDEVEDEAEDELITDVMRATYIQYDVM